MDDKLRRTGRTTRALAAAFRLAFSGRRVVFVVHDPRMWDYCKPILKDLGADRMNNAHKVATFYGRGIADGTITFVPLSGPDVERSTFTVQGWAPENTIWDHEAVRQAHNHIIQRYHEYG